MPSNVVGSSVLTSALRKMKYNPQGVTSAMQLYFGGESIRNTQRSLEFIGTKVCFKTVENWIEKYTVIMKSYADNIKQM